ncbi:peptidoglycan DD-metalloendopeptidase family protein [Inhella inkyongensis]|uniref:peptidoglycan DD-metalloendopeptidase family protein n=1 Tax=Inhella inkyongensis TaxID=392593 RepID=UPI00110D2A9F|nr:peptidoglycan DD-metalloendopeptidase family protein [Inhella inkyongensis]
MLCCPPKPLVLNCSTTSKFKLLTTAVAVGLLAGCAAPKPHRAPVEERAPTATAAPGNAPAVVEPKVSSVEPSRAGSYAVRPGDTLIRIALDHGVSWRDLARWNGLDNPNLIEVGQVLRVVAPGAGDGLSSKPVAVARAEGRPLEARPASGPANASPAAASPTPAAPSSTSAAPAIPSASSPAPQGAANLPDGELVWSWPASGPLSAGFDEQRNKGLAIAGKPGDAVLAAADGRVMYAGSGLRGYGNMVIIKHNDTYLSAYAHNQALLVKEDQVVRKGQRIAEMGSSDADQVKLHFEIRRKGKPIDPAKLLPTR